MQHAIATLDIDGNRITVDFAEIESFRETNDTKGTHLTMRSGDKITIDKDYNMVEYLVEQMPKNFLQQELLKGIRTR